eukprot:5063144-Amphidinium_carterae.1
MSSTRAVPEIPFHCAGSHRRSMVVLPFNRRLRLATLRATIRHYTVQADDGFGGAFADAVTVISSSLECPATPQTTK